MAGLQYDWAKINSIKNFQLIDYGTNRGEKNGKAFALWINNPTAVSDKGAFIKLHLIPKNEDLWVEERFEEFIGSRGELIVDKIKEHLPTLT